MRTKPLFGEFPEVSSKHWKQLVQFDLKGDNYNEALIWKTNEGIDVKPFYHSDESEKLPEISITKGTAWNICQTIFVADVKKSNRSAKDALEHGADGLKFILPSKDISLDALLKDIDLSSAPIYFELQFLDPNFARTGNWFNNLKDDHNRFETIVKTTHTLSIDMGLYQNAGANMVQQLAYGLAHTNEYLNHFDNLIDSTTKQTLKVTFNVSVGTNYFFEIAKVRALRTLWQTLASEYGCNPECNIFATPTKRNKTLYDYNTNMLRTTTECMSAILGGANFMSNLAFDSIYHKTNTFGERIARNQLLILKHESYFDKVNNPSEGAYYIESLTKQLAEKALVLFKDAKRGNYPTKN